jgi:hypothetical protein
MGIVGASIAWEERNLGWFSKKQSLVYKWSFMDFAHGRAVAGFAAVLRKLE